MNLSLLALPCSRILLVQDGVYLPTLRWVGSWLPTYSASLFFLIKQGEDFTTGNRTTTTPFRKWAPLQYHPIVKGHLGPLPSNNKRWPPTYLWPTHLEWPWLHLESLKIIWVSNQLQIVTYGLHTNHRASCWMNERYVCTQKFPLSTVHHVDSSY